MSRKKARIIKHTIHNRTFEGKNDKSKNSNPITSKDHPTLKYALEVILEYSDPTISNEVKIICQKSRKDCLAYVRERTNWFNVF